MSEVTKKAHAGRGLKTIWEIPDQKQTKCVSDNAMGFTKPDPCDRYAKAIEIVIGIRTKAQL